MNIYKERKSNRARYERENERYAAPVNEKKDNKPDTVEYTNMSSYERYCREKLNNTRNETKYNASSNSMRTFEEPYRASRYPYNDDSVRNRRNDNRYDDYNRYENNMRNDDRYMDSTYSDRREYDRDLYRDERRYDRRGDYEFYDYPRQDDNYYDGRRDERESRTVRGSKKKSGMTLKCKFMIIVYFAIIAVITTLILINAVPNAKADSSYNETPSVEISEEMLNKTKDGNSIDKVDYVYEAQSNSVKR